MVRISKMQVLLAVFILALAIPIAQWATTVSLDSPKAFLYDLARILALVAFIHILFQFVLSSKIRLIERGIGLDRLFRVHRRLGQAALVLLVLHPILLFSFTFSFGYTDFAEILSVLGLRESPGEGPLGEILAYRIAANAFLILVGFVTVTLAAIMYGRLSRLSYEGWRRIHYVSYALLPLAFTHSLVLGSDLQDSPLRIYWLLLAGVFAAVLSHRIWRYFDLRRNPYEVTTVNQLTHDTWNLEFKGRPLNYLPGQFMILQLLRGGKTSEPHPFTISSSPTQDALSVSIKSVGDFTSTIRDTKEGDGALVDAPFGVFSFLNHDSDELVFIAGGIGITPFMSMLRYIRDAGLQRRVVLIWGNKTDGDIAFSGELEGLKSGIGSLKVVHVMSHQEDWSREKGYVTGDLIARYVGSMEKAEFFICGPPVMMDAVERALGVLGVEGSRIHDERFALR